MPDDTKWPVLPSLWDHELQVLRAQEEISRITKCIDEYYTMKAIFRKDGWLDRNDNLTAEGRKRLGRLVVRDQAARSSPEGLTIAEMRALDG